MVHAHGGAVAVAGHMLCLPPLPWLAPCLRRALLSIYGLCGHCLFLQASVSEGHA